MVQSAAADLYAGVYWALSSLICIPEVYLPPAGEPRAIQGLTRYGGSFNFIP